MKTTLEAQIKKINFLSHRFKDTEAEWTLAERIRVKYGKCIRQVKPVPKFATGELDWLRAFDRFQSYAEMAGLARAKKSDNGFWNVAWLYGKK